MSRRHIYQCESTRIYVNHISIKFQLYKIHVFKGVITVVLGQVVQSIVSLTRSLRGQLFKSFTTLLPNTLIPFVEKNETAKASQIFSTNKIGVFQILTFEILTKVN